METGQNGRMLDECELLNDSMVEKYLENIKGVKVEEGKMCNYECPTFVLSYL